MCEQPAHLVRFVDRPVSDRVDAMAACSQFLRDGGADAGGIGEDEPGLLVHDTLWLRVRAGSHLIGLSTPLDLEEALVDSIG